MKPKFFYLIILAFTMMHGCANYGTGWDGPGLRNGAISEEDVKADNWERKDLVSSVQSSLHELGYTTNNQDGIEDETTNNAVLKYKAENGLEVNTIIDSNLEKHINDSVWAQRKERSADPKVLAKKYADIQEKRNCEIILGKEYKNITLPKPKNGEAAIYIYRYSPTDSEFNVYPNSNILIDNSVKGLLSDNSFIRIDMLPTKVKLLDSTNIELEIEKRAEPYNLSISAGETYFIRLLAGKYDGSKTYTNVRDSNYWPYWLVGGVAGFLLHQAFNNTVLKPTDKTVKEKFYFADFIETSDEIGKCHIHALEII